MSSSDTDQPNWGLRRLYITALLSQTLGINTILFLPHQAVTSGAAGHAIAFSVIYIVIGIPLLYMENVVGQFTGRDCLEVWRARACLSHLGYIHIFWQIFFGMYLHSLNSFVVHYFLISFEKPVPYFDCGQWSTSDCGILNYNYTVNQDCLKEHNPPPYCKNLCSTFPEYQYWRFHLLGLNKSYYYLPWRVCLASGLISIAIFISYFKATRSLKWVLLFVTVFPMSARVLFMIGSMLQKGVVVKYTEAADSDFSYFSERFSLTESVAEVLYSLGIGTGLAFGSASRTSFRAPCYSNTVIVVVVTCCVTVLGICSTVMMACPYAFKYDIHPSILLKYPLANIFERTPRLLRVYEKASMWLILSFSYIAISATSMSVCIITGLIEMVAKRYPKLARHPALIAFLISVFLYIGSAPLLGNWCVYFMVDMKRVVNILTIMLVMIENIVFVLWYGLERLSEDVHFMQGVQPNASVKAGWLLSAACLVYVFCSQIYEYFKDRNSSMGLTIGWYLLLANIVPALLITLFKILFAVYKKNLYDVVCLDPTWGPESELLKRSRAMFTAQAMTKEYMYRQYHLQAGIVTRQKQSNIRSGHTSS